MISPDIRPIRLSGIVWLAQKEIRWDHARHLDKHARGLFDLRYWIARSLARKWCSLLTFITKFVRANNPLTVVAIC